MMARRGSKWFPIRAILLSALVFAACMENEPVAAPLRRNATISAKSEVFGSILSVPTREGEQARREIAMAGEIERLWSADPRLQSLRVSVQLSRAADHYESTLVAVLSPSIDSPAKIDKFEEELRETAQSVTGSKETRVVLVPNPQHAAKRPQSERIGVLSGILLFAAGASAGLALERWLAARSRRQKSSPRKTS